MACRKNHALRHAKLHFARGQVGHQHGELADQFFGLVHAGNAAEDIAHAAFAGVQRQAQQLGRALYRSTLHDLGNAQVDLGEVVDADGRGNLLAAWHGCYGFSSGLCIFHGGWRLKQCIELLGGDTLHQVLVGRDGLHVARHLPACHVAAHKALHGSGQSRQHGRKVTRQRGKGVDQH